MRALRVMVLAGLVLSSTVAGAVDQPISAVKLLLKRSPSGKASLVFLSKDPAFLFPAIGGADDPASGSPGGALLELFSDADSVGGAFLIPPGIGKPGWKVTDGKVDIYKYVNASAPGGPTPVKTTILKQGKLVKVVAKDAGLALTGAQGAVTVRLTTGSLRSCVRFEGASVARDLPGQFLGKKAPASSLANCEVGGSGTLARPDDPVVLTGADVPTLVGALPDDVVAFRWAPGWTQIPVQIDERKTLNFTTVYKGNASFGGGITTLGYADAGTFAGADPVPTFDTDDELVFMAADAGDRAPLVLGTPPGAISGSGVELTITDPLDGSTGWVYLFRRAGALPPGAGQQYVSYTFALTSGAYLTTYAINAGPNPETSSITTPQYQRRFTDRWVQTELRITDGGASGVDILDRNKPMFGPGVCGRTEETFSNGEGAFIVNKSGPVRALRSYVGANSGPLTQREHVYYAGREDVRTFLRVHAIPGIMDLFDYAPAAIGMTYRNSAAPGGVTIDGNPDSVPTTPAIWEQVTGPQGSLTMVANVVTNITLSSVVSYYLDDSTPPVTQCTGDAFAYGTSGLWLNTTVPNTDPRTPPYDDLRADRIIYYDGPGLGAADGQTRAAWALAPLAVSALPRP
ncbi:MAG: hypothetical protein KIT14_06805 [bacterium]|nr:hypothetical protein [bacterium]